MPARAPQVLGVGLKYPEIAAMTVASDQSQEVAFGPFRLDARGRMLYRDGASVALGTRGIDILCALAASPGALVTKDELISKVWSGAIVEDNAIQAQVSALRKALEDGKGGQRYIVTVPGRGYRFVAEPTDARHSLLDKPSIAVLPFDNMSGDPSQDYFADGVVEDIITALTRVPSLQVIARNSSFAYKGRATDIRQVGRELSVRYVLEGSVRKAGERLRISAQLIQAGTGVHLWAEQFDGSLADVFALQDEITARVVGALVPNLQGAEIARAHRKPPESLDAYDLYLRALACRNALTAEAADEALRLLERALALDPTFVSAAAFAAIMWAVRIQHGWLSSLEHAQAEALRYARMAVRLDPHDAEVARDPRPVDRDVHPRLSRSPTACRACDRARPSLRPCLEIQWFHLPLYGRGRTGPRPPAARITVPPARHLGSRQLERGRARATNAWPRRGGSRIRAHGRSIEPSLCSRAAHFRGGLGNDRPHRGREGRDATASRHRSRLHDQDSKRAPRIFEKNVHPIFRRPAPGRDA